MGLLEEGQQWLTSQRNAWLSVPVEYLRRDGERLRIHAVLGKTLFKTENSYGTTIHVYSRDFLIAADVKPYQGRLSLTLRAEDWRSSAKAQEQAIAAQAAYDAYCRGETLPAPAYYQRMCPHRNDLVAVYQLVQRMPMTVQQLCTALQGKGMNRCRARMIADIFSELGLLRYDAVTETLSKLNVTQKRDLNESVRYREILKLAGAAV